MISQNNFITLVLTVLVAAAAGISQAVAQYPPMQMDGPASAANQRQYPPQPQAQYRPQPQQQYRPQYQPQAGAYGGPAPYGRPAPYARPGAYPGGAPYGPRGPYPGAYGGRSGPWNNGGWNRGPWGGNNRFGNWFGGNRGPYGNNGPFGDMFGGGRNGIWGMHPDEWFTSNPEDGFAYMWDDMINAPSEMGEMPGGWNAPSISVPNPVDIGSEFRDEAPNLMREIPDMINVN